MIKLVKRITQFSAIPQLWLLATVLLFIRSHAEPFDSLYFESLREAESISGAITSLAQDNNGYMWIASTNGLYRYDGYQLKTFVHRVSDSRSLGGNYIRAIWPAKDGKLLIGTIADGLSIYDPLSNTFTNYRHKVNDISSIAHSLVFDVIEDHQEQIWVATDGGLDRFDSKTQKFIHYRLSDGESDTIQPEQIRSLLVDMVGNLWVGSRHGLYFKSVDSDYFQPMHSSASQKNSFYNQNINSLFQSENGLIWIGTQNNGAAWINPVTQKMTRIRNPENTFKNIDSQWVYAIAETKSNEIWFGTIGNGIMIVDATTGRILRQVYREPSLQGSLNHNDIGALALDESGILWIGTWGSGINLFNSNNTAFNLIRHSTNNPRSISNSHVLSILETKNDDILIGTQSNGIDVFDKNKGVIGGYRAEQDNPNSLNDNAAKALAETDKGIIWIGTRHGGLNRLDRNTGRFEHFTVEDGLSDNYIRTLHAASDGTLWVGTNVGLDRKIKNSTKFESISMSKTGLSNIGAVFGIKESANKTIWISSVNGLFVLEPGENTLSRITHDPKNSSSLPHNTVLGLMLDDNDRLWVTTSLGVARLESWDGITATFRSINSAIGIDAEKLGDNLLQDSQGRIWSSDFVVDPSNWKLRRFSKADGVDIGASWLGASEKLSDGRLIFGGNEGMLIVSPDKLKEWTFEPKLAITDTYINNVKLDAQNQKELQLDSRSRSFTVQFSALDFSAPKENRYAYWLKGFDNHWVEVSPKLRVAHYTNLPPGNYTLLIKGTNRLGEWSNHIVKLPIKKIPAWYQTWMAELFFLFIVLMFFYAAYHIRIYRMKFRQYQLSKLIEQRTGDIVLLGEIGKELTSSFSLEEICHRIYSHLNVTMDAHVFSVGFFECEQNLIRVPLAFEAGERLSEFTILLNETNSPATWCINNMSELIIRDSSDWRRYQLEKPVANASGLTESVIYVPLVIRGKTIGCVSIQSLKPNAYTESEIGILRTLSDFAAVALSNARAYEKLVETQKALREATFTDALTGLKNRRFLVQYLDADLAKSRRDYEDWRLNKTDKSPDDSDLIFFLLDIDHFKSVNDTHGHDAGDEVLVQFAELLKHVFRDSDYLVRWGGEEFLVIARFINRTHASKMAARMCRTVEKHLFKINDDKEVSKTCSIGFACFPVSPGETEKMSWTEIISIADHNLYAAKNSGRNAWVGIYSELSSPNHLDYDEWFNSSSAHVQENGIVIESSIEDISSINWPTEK